MIPYIKENVNRVFKSKKIQTLGMDGSEKKITNMVEAAAAKVVAAISEGE